MSGARHYAIPGVEERSLTEAEEFAAEACRFEAGEITADDFSKFRLMRGVYGIRGAPDHHMVRVKVPGGLITADQLDRLAAVAAEFSDASRTGGGLGHVTTRQSVQFHWIHRRQVGTVLRRLAEVGLTSREACSNTVRNVTACHLAGICRDEAFDTWAYAKAVQLHFLRNGLSQNLPRKFKIAFSGCATDCTMAGINDVGIIAAPRRVDGTWQRGFHVYIGGGLGPVPRPAIRLEEWTPAADLIVTCEAVVRVFDRHGNRQNRNAARLKFVIEKLGAEAVRDLVLGERAALLRLDPARRHDPAAGATSDAVTPPPAAAPAAPEPPDLDYQVWRGSNVVAQQQDGYRAVFVALPAGDMTPAQMRGLADLARRHGNGTLSTSPSQQIVLRWIAAGALPLVWAGLKELGLAHPGAFSVLNVVGCPGAQTCNIAVTRSHQLAHELTRRLAERPDLVLDPDLADIRVKISGCPNSCGQHHIADIGLFGNSRTKAGRSVPTYQVLVGGYTDNGAAGFGRPLLRTPAKAVPDLLIQLLDTYREQRLPQERFRDWVQRLGSREQKRPTPAGGEAQ